MCRTSSTVITLGRLVGGSDTLRAQTVGVVAQTSTAKPDILLYVSGIVSRPHEEKAVAEFLGSAVLGPSALLVEGTAGIGKTTLYLQALDQARHTRMRVLTTRPGEAESVVAYSGLADLLGGVEARFLED